MGGAKAARLLRGRPLVDYPAQALAAVCERVVLVCKPGTELPAEGAWELWNDEPAGPRHPAAGIAHAVERARAPVLVCAADMPFVTAAECARLIDAAARRPDSAAVVAGGPGRVRPPPGGSAPPPRRSLPAAAGR